MLFTIDELRRNGSHSFNARVMLWARHGIHDVRWNILLEDGFHLLAETGDFLTCEF